MFKTYLTHQLTCTKGGEGQKKISFMEYATYMFYNAKIKDIKLDGLTIEAK